MNKESPPASPRQVAQPAAALSRVSDRLERLIDAAAAPRLAADGREVRADGWTPPRIRAFLHALADCGCVTDAARQAGLSARSARAFRLRADGQDFALAWDAALELARPVLADTLMSRVLNGCVEVIIRDGEVWGERHRYDNRLGMWLLARLDKKAEAAQRGGTAARLIAGDFDQFVDMVAVRDHAAAGDFLVERSVTQGLWGEEQTGALIAGAQALLDPPKEE